MLTFTHHRAPDVTTRQVRRQLQKHWKNSSQRTRDDARGLKGGFTVEELEVGNWDKMQKQILHR